MDHTNLGDQELLSDSIPVSTTFGLDEFPPPDLCLVSSDGVIFYVHLITIHRQFPTAFESHLDLPLSTADNPMNTVVLDCSSTALNIILYALYDIWPVSYKPNPDAIIFSIDLMPSYAILPEKVILPGCALYDYILGFTPLRPLDVYAMASHHNIHPLAVYASSYLLGIGVHLIAEELCIRMGPVYLTKLARLHVQRSTALKDALLVPPEMHVATPDCTLQQQQQATRVWAHLCSDSIWDMKPVDLAVQVIENTLQQLMDCLTCPECRSTLEKAASKVRLLWASVPRTI